MILIGLGSNLPGAFGAPEGNIREAIQVIGAGRPRILKLSSFWRSAPVPLSDQPWYVNAVAVVETDMPPQELLSYLKAVEEQFGMRSSVRNDARVLDLDILAYNDMLFYEGGLEIPHPRMHERAFVLFPVQEVAPDWVHPRLACTVYDLIMRMPGGQAIERL